jgi:ParB-like chromosome segregation protein Spo0J
MKHPPLKSLHAEASLNVVKLETFRKLSTEVIVDSLRLGQACSLKARPDGTIIAGNHRIKVLRERGVDVDSLTREIIPRD